ncbi:hypothetical protein BLOT_015021 [Blomia tropicalis]|nr:hypothetical protein BLOT_015021 [Blomia tropicalis]
MFFSELSSLNGTNRMRQVRVHFTRLQSTFGSLLDDDDDDEFMPTLHENFLGKEAFETNRLVVDAICGYQIFQLSYIEKFLIDIVVNNLFCHSETIKAIFEFVRCTFLLNNSRSVQN